MPVRIRVAVVGLGMVGQWLLRAIAEHGERLRVQRGIDLSIVAVANNRDGFIYREQGLTIETVLRQLSGGDPITELEGVERWRSAAAGLAATETDILLEVTPSPHEDGEPGLSHIRGALARGVDVATSNKWPIALAGLDLTELAGDNGVQLRAEATVMSGTPVIAALTEGLGGAVAVRLRGVLNATVNYICSRLAVGASYPAALDEAQQAGLAEPDPAADVDGLDSVAKLMILSALVLGRQLAIDDVERRGVAVVSADEVRIARERGERLREIATLDPDADRASVEVQAVPPTDPLFAIDGTTNTVLLDVDPLGEIAIRGAGAGPQLAGQGVFSDLIALARQRARAYRQLV